MQSQPQRDEKPRPTALFSAIFWGKPTTRTLTYAPWGNFDETNSSKVRLRVGSSALSQTCAFYGNNKIDLRQQRNYTDLEIDLMEDKTEASAMHSFAEFEFSSQEGEVQQFILIFTPGKEGDSYQTFSIPFGEEIVPWGSFKLISQLKETLYLSVGDKKATLSSGRSQIFHSRDFPGQSKVRMIGYRFMNGKYKEATAQNFHLSDKQRGIYFLTTRRKLVNVVPMVERFRPLERILGYGTPPLKIVSERAKLPQPSSVVVP